MCYNCNQRGTGICEFDPVPKRRGPDRLPGARQRHGKVLGPRRRRPTRSDKEEEVPSADPRTPTYSAACSGSDFRTVPSNDQNTTWAQIPSPPSSASTNDRGRSRDQPVPGSSGSDASQSHDHRTLLTPSFAFNAPQEGYVANTLKPDDPRLLVSRISTEPVFPSSSSPFSPETPASLSYVTVTSPFSAQSKISCANTHTAIGTEVTGAEFDGLPSFDSTTLSVPIGLNDLTSQDLHVAQPVAIEQGLVAQATYASYGVLAAQQQQGSECSTLPDAGAMLPRRESLGSVVCHLPIFLNEP